MKVRWSSISDIATEWSLMSDTCRNFIATWVFENKHSCINLNYPLSFLVSHAFGTIYSIQLETDVLALMNSSLRFVQMWKLSSRTPSLENIHLTSQSLQLPRIFPLVNGTHDILRLNDW